MGKKGKGRQSGGFGSKSLRAAHTFEWQTQVSTIIQRNVPSKTKVTDDNALPAQRPRLMRLGQLKGILRERQYQESYELLERRRRAGFVPTRDTNPSLLSSPMELHPPGWILHYGKPQASPTLEAEKVVESLQSKCLNVLSRYVVEYLEGMGKEEFHAVLSLLPSDTLSALSEAVSKRTGITDDLAYVIGKHAHIEELCFRSTVGTGADDALTDQGLLDLVPRLPTTTEHGDAYQEALDDWEDAYSDDDDDDDDDTNNNNNCEWMKRQTELVIDSLQLDGVNVGLKRLELIDCLYVTADTLLVLLDKCACITHLSLAGSIQDIEEGVQIMHAIPDLLPTLQVLDVTRCGWMTISVLNQFQEKYRRKPFHKPPIVHCQGCFLPEELLAEMPLGDVQHW